MWVSIPPGSKGDCARCSKTPPVPAVQGIYQQLLRPIPAKPEFNLPEVWTIGIYVCQDCLKPDDVLMEDEPMICERCKKETISYTMSIFNTDQICPDCEEKERAHPQYQLARNAESCAVRRGDLNFPGIGKPEDL